VRGFFGLVFYFKVTLLVITPTVNISGGEFAVPRKLSVNGDRFKYSAAVFRRRMLHYLGL